ncbi:MAG: hypothetical protein PVJ38_01640 [Candidatus Bathyarchaeota archaeon]|jgi:hypothetical protein
MQATFEKGIEIIRSKGYTLDGDTSLDDFATEGTLSKESFRGFLSICRSIREQEGSVQIYSDVDAKVLFLVVSDPDAIWVHYCQFR